MTRELTVILPVLNESAVIARILGALQPWREKLEIIVVDGGSSDNTVALAETLADRVIASPPGRSIQQNAGWTCATGRQLWFLHADSQPGAEHVQTALANRDRWGRFDIKLDSHRFPFRIIEFFINWRSHLTGIATGDQGLLINRNLMTEVGGFPEMELMEDVALSARLKTFGRPARLFPALVTSARRWENHGIVRTVLLMWVMRAAFWIGVSPGRLNQWYRHAR